MQTVAEKLSENDIEFYSSKTFKPLKQKFDPSLVKKGKGKHRKMCEKCHTEGGIKADDDATILAGQGRSYLEAQLN